MSQRRPTDPAAPAAPARTTTRRERWWPEGRRALISTVVATLVAVVVVVTWLQLSPDDVAVAVPMATALTWTLLVACHALLTARAFRGLTGAELERALTVSGVGRDAERLRPSWSVQISSMALIVIGGLVVVPAWRGQWVLLVCAFAMVVASWADTVISFALHYAAIDGGALEFPGEEERAFSDYVYLAVAVQTTFAVPDVVATTRALRRQVTAHTVLAFVFNTVILAVVVTLMLGV